VTNINISLAEELRSALKEQGISSDEPSEKPEIILKIQSTFVIGNPRAWWLSLAAAPTIQVFYENTGHLHLCELAPDHSGEIWFIADEDNEDKLIFSAPLEKISLVLENCRFFEYYIVDKNLKWMITENDHGDLLLSQVD
jgi:hypothetical protein